MLIGTVGAENLTGVRIDAVGELLQVFACGSPWVCPWFDVLRSLKTIL